MLVGKQAEMFERIHEGAIRYVHVLSMCAGETRIEERNWVKVGIVFGG